MNIEYVPHVRSIRRLFRLEFVAFIGFVYHSKHSALIWSYGLWWSHVEFEMENDSKVFESIFALCAPVIILTRI